MLQQSRLLTPPSLARQDALYPRRGPSNSLYLPLGEWPRLPSTARIERAPLHRARSASKEGTWPLPPHPSEAARCASKGIVPATPFPFFSILLDRILKGRLGPYRLSQYSTVLKFFKNSTSGRIKVCRA